MESGGVRPSRSSLGDHRDSLGSTLALPYHIFVLLDRLAPWDDTRFTMVGIAPTEHARGQASIPRSGTGIPEHGIACVRQGARIARERDPARPRVSARRFGGGGAPMDFGHPRAVPKLVNH